MDRGWVVGRGSWVDGSMVDGRWSMGGCDVDGGRGKRQRRFRVRIPLADSCYRSRSAGCRSKFLQRTKEIKLDNLILPFYFVLQS